jgi:hypothetical protein
MEVPMQMDQGAAPELRLCRRKVRRPAFSYFLHKLQAPMEKPRETNIKQENISFVCRFNHLQISTIRGSPSHSAVLLAVEASRL